MLKVRHFPIRGSSVSCELCESMGLGGKRSDKVPPEQLSEWLQRAGYSTLVTGCGSLMKDLPSALKHIDCIHEVQQIGDTTKFYWLVVHELSAEIRDTLSLKDNFQVILIPKKSNAALTEELRRWPKEMRERLSVYWPHSSTLGRLGWTWDETMRTQRNWSASFPYLKLNPPQGWDLHNPEISYDLDLEIPPTRVIDQRLADFHPDVSVVIPTYNSLHPLRSTIHQLQRCTASFEIIVADDGSDDGTAKWFKHLYKNRNPTNLVYLEMSRPRPRRMGGGNFRAGIARNTAAPFCRGKYILFLDSDILLPENYIEQIQLLHEEFDLVQATRLQLKHTAPPLGVIEYDEIQREHLESLTEHWDKFNVQNWDRLSNKWKFVSTFCLSLERDKFFELGAFRRSFSKYGFEDTDLGYRAAQAGMRFHRSSALVYHFKHGESRSEYHHKIKTKHQLLRNSARVFFLSNLDPKILSALPQLLIDPPEGRWT